MLLSSRLNDDQPFFELIDQSGVASCLAQWKVPKSHQLRFFVLRCPRRRLIKRPSSPQREMRLANEPQSLDSGHSCIMLYNWVHTEICVEVVLTPTASVSKAEYLAKAAEYYQQAKVLIEENEDWQASGSMILKALAQERKSENTGLQVMNVIKYQKPKTRLEFNFRSWVLFSLF